VPQVTSESDRRWHVDVLCSSRVHEVRVDVVPRDAGRDYLPDHRAPYDLHVLAAEVKPRCLEDCLGILAGEDAAIVGVVLSRHNRGWPLVQSIRIRNSTLDPVLITDVLPQKTEYGFLPLRARDTVIHV
jgi:hypothetical protein